ncbi:MAG: cryptochrome/photolyase family protein [Gemmatimonadales bacterium]
MSRAPLPTWFVGPWELSTATAQLPPTPAAGRVLLVESTGKGAALPYHRWKLVLVLSALRHFVQELRDRGYEVDHRVAPSYAEGIRAHVAEYGVERVYVQEPAEWGISASLLGWKPGRPGSGKRETGSGPPPGLPVERLPDRRFLTPREEFRRWASGRKLLRMEDFYRWQRRRLGILMEGAEPVGGAWNLDRENRQTARALLRRGVPPTPVAFAPDAITEKVMRLVRRMGTTGNGDRAPFGSAIARPGGEGVREAGSEPPQGHWGSVDGFDLPVTRAQALEALQDFLDHRLADFGPYEDAMLAGETWLYHSRLSAAMNVGLLHPGEMAAAAVERWQAGETTGRGKREEGSGAPSHTESRPAIPLSSVEGFVRQVIGWREYVNGIYWLTMPGYREHNYFGHTRPLPQLYWEPERTDLACLHDSVRMVRDTAYAHHIHRLMVLSNFATLAGVHPLRLSEWFWAGFSDAMEWVELPNVVGMATFGDGGLLASKPYVSSAAYINKMSNYCGGCRYDPKRRTGPGACPFNYLYWTFLDDIRTRRLDVGQRMALVLKQVEGLDPAELAMMHGERERFLASLEPDGTGWRFGYDQG